jgi:PAS domain S-box-containing protein
MSSAEIAPDRLPPPGLESFLTIDQTLLDAIPTAVYVCSADGIVVRFNRRAVELWGRTPRPGDTAERFCGALHLYDADGRPLPHAEAPMAAVLRTGIAEHDRELVIERSNGSRIVVLANVEPLLGPTGRIQGAINSFQDITAQKRAADEAREREDRHRQLLDALPAAIYTTDAQGRITFVNREAAALAGREPDIGRDEWCVTWKLHNEDGTPMPHDQCPMAVALKEQRPVRGARAIAERPDGTRFPFQPYPTPIYDRDGNMTGAINMLVDLTSRQKAADDLRASEQRFRAFFEGARVALCDQDYSALVTHLDELRAGGVTDLRGYFAAHPEALERAAALVQVRDVNDYTIELFEAHGKQELLGPLGAHFTPESRKSFADRIAALWDGKTSFECETVMRSRRGRRLDVVLSINWSGERGDRSLVSLLDVSKQKAYEHRLETLNSIARTLAGELDLERIIQSVTDTATELCGAKFGAFFYNDIDDQGERYVLYALSGAPRSAFEKFGLPRNTEVFDPTFRGTGIIRSDDIRKDPRYGKSAPHFGMPDGHLPVVSYLAVPVIARSGEVLGGLFFGHDQPGRFGQEAEETVAGIAAHAALAIDNARLLRDAQGEIKRRRLAEEAQQRIVSIIEFSDDAIISKDANGIITSWNKGAERAFGYTAGEIVGRPVLTLIPDDMRDEEHLILSRIRSGQRIEHYETVRQRKDGSRINVSLTVSPIKDAEGNVVGASKIARDISERKRAEEALTRRAEEQGALYQLTDRLHRAESLADIYDSALDAIERALRGDRASILLYDDTDTMRFVAWRGLSERYRGAVEGHSPWQPDARYPVPISIDDIETAGLTDELKAHVRAERIRALAFIPLIAGGRLIGKFMTYYSAPHSFTHAEVDLAVTVARQLAFSIERRRTLEARRSAEESLRESERRLELALTAGQMGAWEWNIATGQVIWSTVLEQIHGLEPGTFAGKFEDFGKDIYPEDAEGVLAQIRVCVETGAPYHVVYRTLRPDGTIRWLETFGRAEIGVDGKPYKLAGVCMDITGRKLAEEALQAREAELESIIDRTPFMLTRCSRDLRFGFVSTAYAAMLRKRPEDIIGKTMSEVMGQEGFDTIRPYIDKVLRGERAEYESKVRFENVGEFYLQVVYVPERNENGHVTGWIASILDVTERKQTESQRDLLVAELSHRVKNTLATVISIARQSFAKAPSIEEARNSFDGRILALAQTHGRLAEENWSGVPFDTMLLDEFAPYRLDSGNINVSGPSIVLNPKCALVLGMAFHELVTNAAKYGALSTKSGVVNVDWEVHPDRRLTIRWAETGGPAVTPPRRSGFGRLLLERALASDLRGQVKLDFAEDGLRCEIDVPLDGHVAYINRGLIPAPPSA